MLNAVFIHIGFNVTAIILPEVGLFIHSHSLIIHIQGKQTHSSNFDFHRYLLCCTHFGTVHTNIEFIFSVRAAVTCRIPCESDSQRLRPAVIMRVRYRYIAGFQWRILVFRRKSARELNINIFSSIHRLPFYGKFYI